MCLPRFARCASFSAAAGKISKALPHAVTTTHSEPAEGRCSACVSSSPQGASLELYHV